MMSLRPRLLQATALTLTLASCAVPSAGTGPTEGPAAVVPAAPAAKPPAPVAVPSLAPAPPLAEDARVRLQGSVVFNDQAVANATLTALDLATGQAIALKGWEGATGTQRTDAKGAFDLELPKLADDQVVKLVAVAGTQTFTALFDARGRAVGAAGAQGATYRLAQGRAVSITIRVRLTAATTAAAKAFEGALKLTFQLPREAREAERAAALAAAEQAAREVEAALAAKPELAQDLVVSVGANGEVQDLDAFRSAVAKLGVFDPVFSAVQGRLLAVTAQKLTADGRLDAITAEDFPLDRVTISRGGGLAFTGGQASLGGALTGRFVPTPERPRRRAGGGTPAVDPADRAFTGAVNSPAGVAIYGDLSSTPEAGLSFYTLASDFSEDGDLYLFDAEGDAVGTADLGSGTFPAGLGALPASTTLMVSSRTVPGIRRFARTGPNLYTEVASGSLGVEANGGAVAGGRYWAFSGPDLGQDYIRSWALAGDLSASQTLKLQNGSDMNIDGNAGLTAPGISLSLAVQADGTATRAYWVDNAGKLYRYADTGTTITVEMIKDFGGTDGGAVVAGGAKLYVAVNGSVFVINDPTVASSALDTDLVAPYARNVLYTSPAGGAQARAGSVAFTFFDTFWAPNGLQRFPVPQ